MPNRATLEELWEMAEKAHEPDYPVAIADVVDNDYHEGYWAAFIHAHVRLLEEQRTVCWLPAILQYVKRFEPPPETDTFYDLCKLRFDDTWWTNIP